MNSDLNDSSNSDLNERLAVAKADLRQQQKLGSTLRAAKKSLAVAKRRQAELRTELAMEQADVDTLEGLTMTGLFHAVLGSKQERLETERQELVAAKLKYDLANDTLADRKDDVQQRQAALTAVADAEAIYEQLIAEKAVLLSGREDAFASEMFELSQQISDRTADRKELQEAARAGRLALRAVQEINRTLDSAANWGTLDLFGGGLLTTMAKHSKIDAAKNQASKAQRLLLRFQDELADTDQRLQLSLEIDGFTKFADFFFDGLIADWVVQSKISNAKASCKNMQTRVKTAIGKCKDRLQVIEVELDELTASKTELIEQA